MAQKEPAFEAASHWRMPDLELVTENGEPLSLDDLQDQIVVLSFVTEDCGAPCAEQQAALADVQASLNVTPMRDMVTFVTIHSADQMPSEDWDAVNWRSATLDADATARLATVAADFATLSTRTSGSPMVHVIDRRSRHAAIFHGTNFGRVNAVVYINDLTNAPPPDPSFLDRVLRIFG